MKAFCKATFGKIIHRVRLFGVCVPVLGILAVGCVVPSNSQTKQFAAGSSAPMTASQITAHVDELRNPANKNMYEQVRATALVDMFSSALSSTPTGPVQIGGHTFDNMHDYLAAHESDLQAIIADYGTVGNYADAMGFTSENDITPEQMQATYDLLDKVINQGVSVGSSSSTTTTATAHAAAATINSSTNMTGLALASKLGCGAAVVGAAASAVGTGLACAATLGLGCGVAAVGAVASSVGVANSCDGVIPGVHAVWGGDSSPAPQAGGGNTITTTYGGGQTTTETKDANGNVISTSTTPGDFGGDGQATGQQQQPSCTNCTMTIHQSGQPDKTVGPTNEY